MNLFDELALLFFPQATNATENEIIDQILIIYDRISLPIDAITVVRELLCQSVSFSLIRRNILATPDQVDQQIEYLISTFPRFMTFLFSV